MKTARIKSEEKWRATATLEDALAHGLTDKEFGQIKNLLERELTLVEVGICAALYSEHCSYKSTKVHLRTLPTEGPRVLQGPGENAGVVDIGDGQAVVFKIESHNHPSYIEPFQGAATGVGGILRDIFTMGARPLALMNSLRFGTPEHSRTKYLLSRCVGGIGSYGNCMGIPTVGGELFFHDSYSGNCLVNAFALGVVDQNAIFKGIASGVGNGLFYVGSKTGRDGIHGATMASESFNEDSEEKRPTVQVGDPFQEKLLLEACLEVMKTGAVVGIQDMGAAGMTSSTYEMADRAGTGLRIDLDKVPQREEGMTPYEIMLSESQERMLLVVEAGREQEVLNVFQHWELDAVKIGEVIKGNSVDLFWHDQLISSLPVAVVTRSVPQHRWPEARSVEYEQKISFKISDVPEPDGSPGRALSDIWYALLASINICSRAPVYRQYDSTVRSNTVIHPGGDAAVIRVKNEQKKGLPEKGIAMTLDCNSRFCSIDPRQGAALSVAEACRNIAAVGASPIGISDNLNFGSPERPEGMWQIADGVRGLAEAARAFEVPIISGNVSLYNETKGKAIIPTPVVAMVGLIEEASKCVTIHFKKEHDRILLLGGTDTQELGGSEYMAFYAGIEKGALPVLEYDREIRHADFVRHLIAKELINSCHDLSSGGLAVALAECCFGPEHPLGATVAIDDELLKSATRRDGLLFSESGARYLLSCNPANESLILKMAGEQGIPIEVRGRVGGTAIEVKDVATLSLASAYEQWRNGLVPLFE